MAGTCQPSSDRVQRGKITRTFGEVTFSSEFDSGNLDRVEPVDKEDAVPLAFALWTAPDCAGTELENGNSSWYYFKVVTQANFEGNTLRLTIMNLNKQLRLYQQGFSPIFKTFPGRNRWERLRGPLNIEIVENGQMQLTFDYAISDSHKRTTYFAFCFPFSYAECQQMLNRLDQQFALGQQESFCHPPQPESIYYHRDLLCHSVEGRRVDLLTVSSHYGITEEEDSRLEGLFPDQTVQQAKKFTGKKVFMLTSRVHPGETPSSFVFNGFLNFILRTDDPRAQVLRKRFVFKLIPMLNPDGVARGHYRTSARGLNLNRFYLNPDRALHPSVFAARSVFLYHHSKGREGASLKRATTNTQSCTGDLSTASEAGSSNTEGPSAINGGTESTSGEPSSSTGCTDFDCHGQSIPMEVEISEPVDYQLRTSESGIAFYVDLHGHAAKRGCFIYGNHLQQESDQALNMLYPKLISLNSAHFDFSACLFSEKNMYASDRSGLTKEGSGRVALHKASGHLHCYTLECNYNSGRLVNGLSAATTDSGRATPPPEGSPIPHKYSIEDFEEVGRGVAVAALDYFQINPWSRLPTSDYGSLTNVRLALLQHIRSARAVKDSRGVGKKAGGGGAKSSRVPSASSSSRVGSTRDRVLGDLKVKNGRDRLVSLAVESKSSSSETVRIKPKSSRTTVKPALATMNASSSSLGIMPKHPPLQQNAAIPSRLSSTRLLPVIKKPRIPYRIEFLNMKSRLDDKAQLAALPHSNMSLSNQQRVADIDLSPVHSSTSKVGEGGVIDRDTVMHSSSVTPFGDNLVMGSMSSNGLSPPRVAHNRDTLEKTTVARRWEAKGKLLKRRPSYPPQVSSCVMFSNIDTSLVHPVTGRQLPFCSFVKPKPHSASDLNYLNHSF